MKKRKKRKLKFLVIIIFIISILVFGFSLYKIIRWKLNSNNTDKQIDKIQQDVVIEEVVNEENVEIIEQEELIEENEENPYWDYIKMNLISVDFNELKKVNSDTAGWIQVNGTNINYPYVKTKDNNYYLNHSFDKSYNSAGWVFLDYRNNPNSLAKNNIIYAHSMLDGTMFGTLKNILKNGWLDNTNNYVIKLSNEKENTMWQVFSVYHIPTTNDYIQIDFANNEEFENWVNLLISRSSHNFNTSVSKSDIVLTLSTCYKNNEKLVMHAKLIKKEKR